MLHENAGPFATSAPPPPRMFLWQLLHAALPTHPGTRSYQTYDKKNKHLSVQSSQSACTPRPSGLGNSQPPPPTHRWPARRHRARSCWGSRSTYKHNIM